MTGASGRAAAGNRVALVETTDPYQTVLECVPLFDAGYDVVLCAGPRPDQSCPALDGQPCPLVEHANIVINAVSDGPTQVAIAGSVRDAAPDVPMAVIVDDGAVVDLPPGCMRYRDIHAIANQLRRVKRRDQPAATLTVRRQRSRAELVGSRSTS